MEFAQPLSWVDTLSPMAGGTDGMVELNFNVVRRTAFPGLTVCPNRPSGARATIGSAAAELIGS